MDIITILANKRDGLELSAEEIAFFVRGAVDGSIADYQVSALLMAGRINGFSKRETLDLTREMAASGQRLDLSGLPGIKVDKHSTGGVGDKTSLILLPVAAAAGLLGAKMSGRGLGHTGGTIDKLESIPGLRVDLPLADFLRQVDRVGLAIVSQSGDLAPADKLFYALRDVTATVDSIPLITASIMSKKLATGADVLVLDVKYGSGALMPTLERSRELAELMLEVARGAGLRASAVISSMEQPLGCAVGNALEVREALEVLAGGGPPDLRQLSLTLAGELIFQAGLSSTPEGAIAQATELLDSGAARQRFCAMIRAQGGSDDFSLLPVAAQVTPYLAAADGYITDFDTRLVGQAASLLGAGRLTKEDRIDPAAGLVFQARIGQPVTAGQTLAWLHGADQSPWPQVRELLDAAVVIGPAPQAAPPLIHEIIR